MSDAAKTVKTVAIRLTENEHNLLKSAALIRGRLTLAAFMRQVSLLEAKQIVDNQQADALSVARDEK